MGVLSYLRDLPQNKHFDYFNNRLFAALQFVTSIFLIICSFCHLLIRHLLLLLLCRSCCCFHCQSFVFFISKKSILPLTILRHN